MFVNWGAFFFKFISADVFGVCCVGFCDFGDNFEIIDEDGEEPKEIFIEKISKVMATS